MKKTLFGITQYTDQIDWQGDHNMSVIPDSIIDKAEVLLLCSNVGEDRKPPPSGDEDITVNCRCGQPIVKRKSAPVHAIALCGKCFVEEIKDGNES